MSQLQAIQVSEIEAVQVGIEILSQSSNAQDLCRRIAHAEFMDGFCHGVAVFLLDQRSMLVEVAGYGQNHALGQDEISTQDLTVLSKAVRSRNISVETLETATLYALPIELAGVITGAFLFTLSAKVPNPVFSKQVTKMLSRLGGLFMDNKGLSLKTSSSSQQPDSAISTASVQEMTTRQLTILQLMADGLTNAAIAKIVLLSESTVRQETIRIFRILRCHSRTEAIVKARAIGLLASV